MNIVSFSFYGKVNIITCRKVCRSSFGIRCVIVTLFSLYIIDVVAASVAVAMRCIRKDVCAKCSYIPLWA